MKYLLRLAWANIRHSRVRTILTFLIITFGIGFYVMFDGFILGLRDKNISNLIDFETGHFKVRSRKFDPLRPYAISNFITNYEEVEQVLRTQDYVKGFTARVEVLAEIDNGVRSLPIELVGIDPTRDTSVYNLTNFISQGKISAGAVLLGQNLAADLEVEKDMMIFLTLRSGQGMTVSRELRVGGIVNAADPQVNTSIVYMNLDELQDMLNYTGVTEVTIRCERQEMTDKYLPELRRLLPGYQVEDWKKLGEASISFAKADAAGFYFFVVFLIIIGLVGIINTMLMSVYEKRVEIGTLKAMGMNDRQVQRLFVLEGIIIGCAGSLLGILFGTLINIPLVINGIDFTAMMGGRTDMNIGYKIMGVVKSKWSGMSYIYSFLVGTLASGLASFYPAHKTTRMQAVECLRTQQ